MPAATGSSDYSDSSMLATCSLRRELQSSLKSLVSQGIRLHVLTMGMPETSRALLAVGGYDIALFSSFLGPCEMAKNQGLPHLFDGGGFQFQVQEDLDALYHLQRAGEQTEILERIMTMEQRLSKAEILSVAGPGGLLIDNYPKNIFDAKAKDVMHVDPEGVLNTSVAVKDLADMVRKGCKTRCFKTDFVAPGRSMVLANRPTMGARLVCLRVW